MRSLTPYVNGQKNEEYIPQHLNTSIDFTIDKGEKRKKYISYLKKRSMDTLNTSAASWNNVILQNDIFIPNKSLNDVEIKDLDKSVNIQKKPLQKSTSVMNVKVFNNKSKREECKGKTLEELNVRIGF